MLAQMRQELPSNGEEELLRNKQLSKAVGGDQRLLRNLRYACDPTQPPKAVDTVPATEGSETRQAAEAPKPDPDSSEMSGE
jgi:hypothetical protein